MSLVSIAGQSLLLPVRPVILILKVFPHATQLEYDCQNLLSVRKLAHTLSRESRKFKLLFSQGA